MIQGLVVVVWLVLCAMQDIRQRQIANRLTLGVALLALLYLLWSGSTWLGTSRSEGLWALILALLLTLPGYALGRLGAADVKMLAALALASNSTYLLWSLIGAGAANVAWLVYGPRLLPLASQGVRARLGYLVVDPSKKLPFAPFLLVGFTLAWPWLH
ncbi:prepilin peptidase [Pseudomonas sp. WS 5059]|uniref:prepilin peptidase n=1 Tax=unclassified Pseudomonas TaxID=196821 RepID=UPI001475BCC8|nr:prepilin peptidase [Pseudomonas sp. WS 5111]NMX87915.1 prepilin peptidase [Pseudomonas sp. WS 5010]NMY04253.1 prepilin peptidase [Pseudomonas sp. WS 5059]NMY29608.1 prepilin peptidase [Pseudomonas sp. WS 5021]